MGTAVRLSGAIGLTGPDAAVDVGARGRRVGSAFAYLALAGGRAVTRDALADAVWDARPPASWPSALRTVIAGVRAALQEAGIDAGAALRPHHDGYLLELPEPVELDVEEAGRQLGHAEDLLAAGEVEAAKEHATRSLAVARQRALPGCAGSWVHAVEVRMQSVAEQAGLALGRCQILLGNLGGAERIAQELLAADPLLEPAHRMIMEAREAGGDLSGALRAYESCRQTLLDEIGTTPGPETERFHHHLLAASVPATNALIERPIPGALTVQLATPLVGRDRLLDQVLARAPEPRADLRCVAVVGEAGSGKSRLAAAMAEHVHRAGSVVLYGRADQDLGIPYRPFVEALRPALAALEPADVERILERRPAALRELLTGDSSQASTGASPATSDQRQLYDGFVDLLTVVRAHGNLLLVLDDLHWASSPTWDLLAHLLVSAEVHDVTLLVLARPAAAARINAMRDRGVERIDLPPLSADDIRALVQMMLPQADAELTDVVERVQLASGGNPLYATQYLAALRASPAMAHDEDTGAALRLRELVQRRVAALPPRTAELLYLAAAAGEEFELTVVADAAGLSIEEAQQAVARAMTEGLVERPGSPDVFVFRHALVRQGLVDGLSPARREQLHRRVGEALEGRGRDSAGDAVQLAHHFLAGPTHGWVRASRYAARAARAAADALVHEDALSFARRGLDVLEDAGWPDLAASARLRSLAGEAMRVLGIAGWDDMLAAAWKDAIDVGDPVLVADAALACAAEGAASDESWVDEQVISRYRQALDLLPVDEPRRRARLLARLASATAWTLDGVEGRRFADEALAVASEIDDRLALASVLSSQRRIRSGSGRVDEQNEIEDRLLGLSNDMDLPGLRTRALLWRLETSIELGAGDRLEDLLRRADAEMHVVSSPQLAYTLAYNRAALALLRGRPDEAEALSDEAARTGIDNGVAEPIAEAIHMIQRMGIRHEQGRLDEIRDEFEALTLTMGVPEWLGAVAFMDAELGDLERVATYLPAAVEGVLTHGARVAVGYGFAAHLAAPVAAIGDQQMAAALYDWLEPYAGRGAMFSYFGGPVDYGRGLLAESLGRLEAARNHFEEAHEFAEGIGAPLWSQRAARRMERLPT